MVEEIWSGGGTHSEENGWNDIVDVNDARRGGQTGDEIYQE